MKKRHGIAVLAAVLISAIIFVAIVAVAGQVVPEKNITTSDDALKRALSSAEAGVAQSTSDLKTAAWITGDNIPAMQKDSYLTGTIVRDLLHASVNGVVDAGKVAFPSGDVRISYQVKLVKLSGTPWNYTSGLSETQRVRLYALGEVKESATGTVIGRRIVQQDFDVPINITVTENPFDYGILALGGTINTQGISHVYGGSIRANGDITSNGSNDRVDTNYYMYATGNVSANPVGSRRPGFEELEWVPQELADYVVKATEWKQLLAALNKPLLTELVTRDLGAVGSPSTIAGINRFCAGVKGANDGYQVVDSITLAQVRSLLTPNGWYWVEGDVWLKQDDLLALEGTVAIHGNVTANGSAQAGNPGGPLFVVFGDFDKGNGGSDFYGMIYVTGSVGEMTGGLTIHGSLVSEKSIGKCNATIYYQKTSGLPGLGTGSGTPPGTYGAVSAVTSVSNTWSDRVDQSTFTSLH